MYPIIEKGYLYIAQPPLYKVKRGRKESYLKNDQELANFLLEGVLDSVEVNTQGKPIPQSQLMTSLKAAGRYEEAVFRNARKIHPQVLRGLVAQGITSELMEDKSKVEKLLENEKKRFESRADDSVSFSYELSKDEEHNAWAIEIETQEAGSLRRGRLDAKTVESPEFEELRKHYNGMIAMGLGPFEVLQKDKGGESVVCSTGEDLYQTVTAMAREGLSIQRYKGLGEMNPSQLWETTMDPSIRTLLKVSVEDAVESDSIFSVLMGDQVEPRRQFIENNALRVRNLDI